MRKTLNYQSPDGVMRKLGHRALVFVLTLNALIFTYAGIHSLFYLGDLTVPEAAIIYPVKGLLTGQWPLYRDFGLPPYGTTPYTPLYYLISAFFSLATDKSTYAIYIVSRLLTFASTFGAAFLVRKIYTELQPDERLMRPLALLLPFTILTLINWGYTARPDMMAVLLSLTGIWLCLPGNANPLRLYGGAVVLAVAWNCKQSFVAAPCAVVLYLLSEKAWRRAIFFVLIYGTATDLFVAQTQYLSGGWFYTNIITANITILRPEQLVWLMRYGYLHLAPFIVAAALLGIFIRRWEFLRMPRSRCIALYLLTSVALSMAACLKEGAYFNYMLEPLFAACIPAAFGLQWLLKRNYGALAVPVLLLASLLFSYHSYWYFDGAPADALGADISDKNRQIETVIRKIDSIPGDVLIYNLFLALRADKTVFVTDLFNTRYLELKGKLSTSLLVERISRHELNAVIAPESCQPLPPEETECKFWPQSLQQAIAQYYEPHETINQQVFWYPKQGVDNPAFPH